MTAALSVAVEDCPCLFGCPPSDRHVLSASDRLHHLPGRFSVVECNTCGLLRTNPRPTPESIAYYYPAEYGPYHSTRIAAPSRRISIPLAASGAEAIPRMPPGRLLEIGCASGAFLDRMARRGWRVEGIEFSAQAASQASSRGFHVYAGPLETAPAPAQPFDLVAGWMVVEHLHDPLAGLRKLRAWTHAQSWLAISVPNAACFERAWFGDAWFALHLPNHLFHFTPATLDKLLHAAGWRIERILYQRDLSNTVASLGYRLQDRGLLPALARAMVSYPWWGGRANLALLPLSYPLSLAGQTGRMTIWARHRELP